MKDFQESIAGVLTMANSCAKRISPRCDAASKFGNIRLQTVVTDLTSLASRYCVSDDVLKILAIGCIEVFHG